MRMHEFSTNNDIESWLASIRVRFSQSAPHLLPLFDIYAAEAIFGRRYISADLKALAIGAKVLEVGAGSFMLSLQLVREGFDVTALEPTGAGFSHFFELRKIIFEDVEAKELQPRILNMSVERLDFDGCFDFAYSINVMEHVDDIEKAISNVVKGLVVGACYRFTCPNYFFPYEPHFNIPTLFSKVLTEKFLGWKIFGKDSMQDPIGTWNSLNWINAIQVRKIVRKQAGLDLKFNRTILVTTFERIATDPLFRERRSPLIRNLILILLRLQIYKLFGLLPAIFQPIMDCSIEKKSVWRSDNGTSE